VTECTPEQLSFGSIGRREIVAKFDGGTISSNGGVLLLSAVEKRIKLLERFAECFADGRDARFVEHPVRQLVSQRGLALGYEDLNDHDALRRDPLLAAVVGAVDVAGMDRRRSVDRGCALAGKSTLNRLELSSESEDPLHGQQEGRFFHGYYGNYCYLPLYIFCGEQLLCARLRTANRDAAAGTQEELARLVSGLRAVWPKVQIILRGDSGFCRENLLSWCESEGVDYIVGLAKNSRLKRAIGQQAQAAEQEHQQTWAPARRFHAFAYRTRKSWSTSRWVIGKAEHLAGGANPRFIVTMLLDSTSPIALTEQGRRLYEQVYCARGEIGEPDQGATAVFVC